MTIIVPKQVDMRSIYYIIGNACKTKNEMNVRTVAECGQARKVAGFTIGALPLGGV
jgi:hypothetical protein